MCRTPTLVLSLAVFALAALAGCQNPRYRALETYPASGLGFQPSDLERNASLKKGQDYALHTLREAKHQGLYYLQVAPGKTLPGRYHHGQDLTLVGAAGNAVVEVEDRRYKVTSGNAVFIPRTHAYSVTARQGPKNFAAYIICAPPYDPDAVELTGD